MRTPVSPAKSRGAPLSPAKSAPLSPQRAPSLEALLASLTERNVLSASQAAVRRKIFAALAQLANCPGEARRVEAAVWSRAVGELVAFAKSKEEVADEAGALLRESLVEAGRAWRALAGAPEADAGFRALCLVRAGDAAR